MINIYLREKSGSKGTLHKLRKDGFIPAVWVNAGENISVSIDKKDLKNIGLTLFGSPKKLDCVIDGKNFTCYITAVQRDPVTDKILHLDIMSIDDKTSFSLWVPFSFVNMDKSDALKKGAFFDILLRGAYLSFANIKAAVSSIEVDVESYLVGDKVILSNILDPNLSLKYPKIKNNIIASVIGKKVKKVDEEKTEAVKE